MVGCGFCSAMHSILSLLSLQPTSPISCKLSISDPEAATACFLIPALAQLGGRGGGGGVG